jgi:rare lipoprotein A
VAGLSFPTVPALAADTVRRFHSTASALALALLLGACVSGPSPTATPSTKAPAVRPGPAPASEKDGPDLRPPPDLERVPDAEPQVEPVRAGGPNKPYEVLGRDHVPLRGDPPFVERGLASWYGRKFHGRRTASGEVYNMYAMTAAHKTMPIPSYARVRNPKNGREVIVRINDRGPFHSNRVIDLSYTAALKLGVLHGVAQVEVERITHEQIRTGAWRRPGESASPPAVVEAKAPVSREDPPAAVAVASAEVPAPAPSVEAVAAVTDPQAAVPVPSAVPVAAAAEPSIAGRFWLQLGAFRQREGAERFQRRVSEDADWLAPLLAVFSEPSLFRLQAGPYASRGEAQGALERVREVLKLVPVIVERGR